MRYSQVFCNANVFPEIPLEEPTELHILSDPIEYTQKLSLIEDSIEYPFHDIITESYKKTYDKISMVCDDTRPCSPYNDDSLEGLLPYDLFLKKMSMKMRTSITWSMAQVTETPLSPTKILMRSPGHSWKIQSMT